ncbi:hypothetical protein [Pontibacter amylolyticus]|uniref:STAS/SEC14 domain-containing protein n=1 Tax=Pontibacter amylolyticus TaxID=1424080 RepID=A0ABQ1WIY8_9BACT|nr:hypothetical protein [Pontibacter amylolyticus]GGG31566.1 hypothetical protein GCM10011323_38690 [Pontibacter amylolyticus]
MVYFQTDYLLVEYHVASHVLLSQWYGKCSSLQYRQALIKLIRLARELGAPYAITDSRLLTPLDPDDLAWTRDVYAQAFSQLPLKRSASLNPFDPAAHRQLQQVFFKSSSPLPFETREFDDLTSAYDWLTSEE